MEWTAKSLKLVAMWKRAWYGRLVHCFVASDKTLCGEELVPHGEYWQTIDYPTCKKCLAKYRRIMKAEE